MLDSMKTQKLKFDTFKIKQKKLYCSNNILNLRLNGSQVEELLNVCTCGKCAFFH